MCGQPNETVDLNDLKRRNTMKKWRCTVCNYIHAGESPPEICPVCGADKSKFVEISLEEAMQYEKIKQAKPNATHTVDAKPQPGRFEQTTGSSDTASTSQPKNPSGLKDFIERQLIVHHAHPVTVHVPNGVLPIVVLFMFIAAIFGSTSLGWAAFYFTLVVVISMPVVMYTGYNEWVRKYKGARTSMFMIKIAAAFVVAITSLLVVLWFFINPDVIFAGAARRGSFLILNLIMLVAAGIAGYIGGKLVFKD